ncbi:DUF5613 domain-containing protein [Neobacillus niacini]|uniref:DUF5613 domain-containing protein n=1 Tax=Neobacillus niacini TaxID=86668 RepID=UPI0037C608CB
MKNSICSLYAFKEAENYLRDYHLKRGQKHVKFSFPDNITTGKIPLEKCTENKTISTMDLNMKH